MELKPQNGSKMRINSYELEGNVEFSRRFGNLGFEPEVDIRSTFTMSLIELDAKLIDRPPVQAERH
jgi:hypothetical protein